ncbi:MAG: hypothetical protein MI975_06310 [Cytophagales bacterium]|nr:hypothetical protein [Cytophagales bacterium]
MLNSNLEYLENSEALLTVGQIILHYQYHRIHNDTYTNWCVGIFCPTKESKKTRIEFQEYNFEDRIETGSIVHWKVDSKNTADYALKKLLGRGFLKDDVLADSGYRFEPVSQYHVFLYRRSNSRTDQT